MHFIEVSKDGSKNEKLSSSQIDFEQMKHHFKNIKEVLVENVTIFSIVVLCSIIDQCTSCGMDFTKPI